MPSLYRRARAHSRQQGRLIVRVGDFDKHLHSSGTCIRFGGRSDNVALPDCLFRFVFRQRDGWAVVGFHFLLQLQKILKTQCHRNFHDRQIRQSYQ